MLYEHLSSRTLQSPDKVAVLQGQRKVTYEELDLGVSRFAFFLSGEGLQSGDRTAILLDNSPEYIVAYLGVHKAGGISVAVNTQSSVYELKKIFDNCMPSVLVTSKKQLKSSLEAIDEGASIKTIVVADVSDTEELMRIMTKIGTGSSRLRLSALQSILESSDTGSTLPKISINDIPQ